MKGTRKKKEPVVTVEEKAEIIDQFTTPAKNEEVVKPSSRKEAREGFGIEWFGSEKDADMFHRTVRQRGDVYGAGPLKGMSCGREPTYDRDGMFAVTFNKG